MPPRYRNGIGSVEELLKRQKIVIPERIGRHLDGRALPFNRCGEEWDYRLSPLRTSVDGRRLTYKALLA
jgi:hypothetical protein